MMQYPAIAFVVTFVILVLLLKTRLVGIVLDQPNHRSLHSKVTPRTGGLAIMAGLIAEWGMMGLAWIWVAVLVLLMAISLIDDIRGLPVRWRFAAQLAISALFVWVTIPGAEWWLLILLTLAITWMINLYNFMDGSDGLAGGMALFGFSGYALAAYFAHDMQFAVMGGCIAAASLAFLLFNFHPARIFMGDAGSVPLGFLAGAMGVYGWQHALWPAWFPLLVFSPFVVDASVTLLKRLCRGERFWQAHRSHYYQRLIQLGWGHRKTAIAEYILMLAVGLTALLSLDCEPLIVGLVLVLWGMVYALLMWLIDRQWNRKQAYSSGI